MGHEQAVTDATAVPERLQRLFDGLAARIAREREAEKEPARQHEADLRAFFAGLKPAVSVAEEAQRRLDRVAATNFSVFRYFKENENRISGIFADLLRPDGSHGQGTTFLRLFLEEIDAGKQERIRKVRDYGSLERCSVYTEYPTAEGRRIDIVLKLGDMWLGVENKPWAGEQDDQLQDYLDFLRRKDEQAGVIYLSGRGEDAQTINDEDKDYYITIPYGHTRNGPSVARWIAKCHRLCDAENVRWFLKDLLKYIRRWFYAEHSEEFH